LLVNNNENETIEYLRFEQTYKAALIGLDEILVDKRGDRFVLRQMDTYQKSDLLDKQLLVLASELRDSLH